jgi:hypothetical protein
MALQREPAFSPGNELLYIFAAARIPKLFPICGIFERVKT